MRSLLFFCAALLSACAATNKDPAVKGPVPAGCEGYQIPLGQEFRDWELGASTLDTTDGKNGSLLPLNKRLNLRFGPKAGSLSAELPLRVANSGIYKIALGAPAKLEIAEKKGGAVSASQRESQPRCEKIRAALTFELKGGRDYLIKVENAEGPALDMMISKQL